MLMEPPLRVVCTLIFVSAHSLLDLSFERVFELRHLIVQLPLLLLLCLLFVFILSAALHESASHLLCFGLALSGSPTTAAAAAAAAAVAVAVAVAVECRAEWAAQLFVPHSKQYTHTHTHCKRDAN